MKSSGKRYVMDVKKKTLTLDLEPTFQRRLKVVASLKGVTMRQYSYTAIDRELAQDDAQGIASPASSHSDAARFKQLHKNYFDGSTLSSSGAEFIREAREARDAQLEGLG